MQAPSALLQLLSCFCRRQHSRSVRQVARAKLERPAISPSGRQVSSLKTGPRRTFLSGDGLWRIRPIRLGPVWLRHSHLHISAVRCCEPGQRAYCATLYRDEEVREGAIVQANAFYQAKGLAVLDQLLLRSFQVEAGLFSGRGRACLNKPLQLLGALLQAE